MAISMGAALLGSAIIGGGASVLGASANKKAINSAANQQNQATQQNLALQRDIYNQNANRLSPYDQRGNAAGSAINALLGVSGGDGVDWGGFVTSDPWRVSDWRSNYGDMSIEDYGRFNYNYDLNRGQASDPNYSGFDLSPYQSNGSGANSAFNNYLNSTGYQFQLGEMNKGANAQFRAAGALDSGAAVKAAQDRAQNMSTNYFNNYLAQLGNQQGVGLSAASAVAGVGQNYANAASGINQNNANVIGNLALDKGQNTNALYGNLASSFGRGAGALSGFGRSGGIYGGALGGVY